MDPAHRKGKDDDLYIIPPVKPGDAVKAATDGVTLEKAGHEADPQAAIRIGMQLRTVWRSV